ncbi:methyl-accepting chemotaxis protein [Hydrogenophaga pseudoflava]|uniref:Methyl-accepting chemotaxis protein III n=1 Tax=Hydrogenophaga pseudoflava TaxID=47421 RepID=A0A4P6X070_HYDPS|nr:methyl-accepting chemotaxis protein [Hydrogenophaga pseudoflava]QBM27111.1 Methyl-accepting chemotaxis protein III [Hydrogenophaga pseudoflava]
MTPVAPSSRFRPGAWSLTTKLSLSAVLLCVLCVGATSAVVGLQASDRARQAASEQARVVAEQAAAQVGGELGRSFAAVLGMAASMEGMKSAGHPPSREQLDDMARQLLVQRKEFIGTYSIWEPNALDGRDAEYVKQGPTYDDTGRYIAYWHRGTGQITVEALLNYEKEGENDWYAIPRKTLKPALIEPYVYPLAGKDVLLATMVTPVLVDGKFVAATGADMSLADLSERLSKLEPLPGGRLSLLSNGGLYLASQDKARLGKRADDLPAEVLAHIAKGEPHVWDDGQGWVHLYTPVTVLQGTAPWSVAVSYPLSVAAAAAQQQLYGAVAAAAVACALAAVFMTLLVRSLMRPLRELGRTMNGLASGSTDLRVELPVRGTDELSVIAQGFNGFASKLRSAFSEVGDVSGGVANASREIATGNADLSVRTEQQASHLQQSASAMRELTEAVAHSAESSDHAAQLARDAVAQAHNGQNVMRETRDAMDKINESSRRIADITGLIDSIAFQTNILALNAAVEAARAGDQGRGFAVVAGEVRTLAQRSATAAKDIRQLTVDSVDRVASGAALIRQAETSLNQLGDAVQQVDQLLSEVSQVTREQSGRIRSVTDAIGELDQNTQQNAAIVEQAAAAADSLQQQSARLVQTVREFVGQS